MPTLLLLALALAMDSFAAALCQGTARGPALGTALRVGAAFGAAQGLMPLLGWALGTAFSSIAQAVDHWVALLLLGLLGGRMIREGLAREAGDCGAPLSGWALFLASIGTSVDAAAAGVTLPLLGQPLLLACAVIGSATAVLSFAGVYLGKAAGARLGKPAELLGGGVLILLGIKIFVEHHFLGG